ncbi:MAG TPA: hypothetical protein VGL03_06675 [Thermoanaerobaculia bacterium]|jgi:hypothetical protein
MRARRLFTAVLLAAGLAVSAFAEVATRKFPWQPVNGQQDVEVTAGKVVVSHVEWDTGRTLKGTPIRKSSAKVRIRLDNNGDVDSEVGVAVVVFDAEGNVVAAGSNGTKWGYLNKGDRTYYDIDFPYVYRRLDQAANFLVTIETKEKGTRRYRSRASGSSPSVETEPLPTPIP